MIDKSLWGEGPWQNEPDRLVWTHPESGYQLAILRAGDMGHLCGYVGIPPSHPVYQRGEYVSTYGDDCEELALTKLEERINALEAHGGITFTNQGLPREPKTDSVWWIGFDCAHSGDLSPGMEFQRRTLGLRSRYSGGGLPPDTYCDWDYVKAEVESLAMQLRDIEYSF